MKRFRDVRQALGMTQQKFAEGLRISAGALSKIEIEDRVPSEQLIHSLCITYGVNDVWMHTGEGEMFVGKVDSLLDRLCEEKGLTAAQRALVAEFLELSPRARELISDYVVSVADRIRREQGAAAISKVGAAFEASRRQSETSGELAEN